MSTLEMEDVTEFNGTLSYIAPNEDHLVWRDMIKGIPIYSAAGICSAGEVGLLSILPSVRRRLVLVDHSYHSLAIAMLKYLLIREKGYEKAVKLLTAEVYSNLGTELVELEKLLPKKCQGLLSHSPKFASYRREKYNYQAGRYEYTNENRVNSEVKTCWSTTPINLIERAAKKLDKVSFLHGDMSDLTAQGPFGLFYISNALEHHGRQGTHWGPSRAVYDYEAQDPKAILAIEEVVKPGGYVLATNSKTADARWERVKEQKAKAWTQVLYRTPK